VHLPSFHGFIGAYGTVDVVCSASEVSRCAPELVIASQIVLPPSSLCFVDCECLRGRVSHACPRTYAFVPPSLLWHVACCSRAPFHSGHSIVACLRGGGRDLHFVHTCCNVRVKLVGRRRQQRSGQPREAPRRARREDRALSDGGGRSI